jgi:hypothetical protein
LIEDVADAKKPPSVLTNGASGQHSLADHLLRFLIGQRLFDDALSCNLPDDEVMTTGFPPYQYEKYSENLFRAQWTGRTLPMRENYR